MVRRTILEPISEPRLDTAHDEQLFEDRDVLSDGLVIEPDLTSYLGQVDESPRMLSEDLDQASHPIEFVDLGDVAHVSGEVLHGHSGKRRGDGFAGTD
jgi:hypothetical protein